MYHLPKIKKRQIIILLVLFIFMFSCKEESGKKTKAAQVENLEADINFDELTTNFIKWWTYHSYNISLSSDFIGLNETSDTIGKRQFLERLMTSNYIPIKLNTKDGQETYKLFKLGTSANHDIGTTMKNQSITSFKHYNMEGSSFPEFDFTDLNGNRYTNENTKGKIVVLKTWFINCVACVAEFPELNELVEKYEHRDDILFLSLATDPKFELEDFLQKKEFKYEVVPSQNKFIQTILNLQFYPTHVIVDKNGTILKVVNKASEMISFLESYQT